VDGALLEENASLAIHSGWEVQYCRHTTLVPMHSTVLAVQYKGCCIKSAYCTRRIQQRTLVFLSFLVFSFFFFSFFPLSCS